MNDDIDLPSAAELTITTYGVRSAVVWSPTVQFSAGSAPERVYVIDALFLLHMIVPVSPMLPRLPSQGLPSVPVLSQESPSLM